jgi:hypothetical protein
LKQFSIFIFVLLLLVPPVQAHADAIVFDIDVTEIHIDDVEGNHEDEHHQNDSEDEKNTNHHHHCTMLGFSYAVISPINTFTLVGLAKTDKAIIFHKSLHTSNHLDTLIEPPRAC